MRSILLLAVMSVGVYGCDSGAGTQYGTSGYPNQGHSRASNYQNTVPQTPSRPRAPQPPPPSYYRLELELVRASSYKKQRLMNNNEQGLYWDMVRFCNANGYRLFAQVSLGEILSSNDTDAYRAINSKRVDFCITDKGLYPVAIVEYQGGGHVNSTSEERDMVKREAIERAGIVFVSVNIGSEKNINAILKDHLVA